MVPECAQSASSLSTCSAISGIGGCKRWLFHRLETGGQPCLCCCLPVQELRTLLSLTRAPPPASRPPALLRRVCAGWSCECCGKSRPGVEQSVCQPVSARLSAARALQWHWCNTVIQQRRRRRQRQSMCRYVGESLRVCARAFALVCVVLCAPLTHTHTERDREGEGERAVCSAGRHFPWLYCVE